MGPVLGGVLGEIGPRAPFWAAAALSTLALVAVFRLGLGMAPVLVGAATLGIALWATGLA